MCTSQSFDSVSLFLLPPSGVGGLSGLLGWTEAQKEANRTEGFAGGALNIIKVLAVLLVIDLVWFGYEVGAGGGTRAGVCIAG
jgi:hypothetical protein